MMKSMYATMGALSKAFYEKDGEDALPVIAEIMGEAGKRNGELASSMLKNKGMKAVGELFDMWEMFDMGIDVVELSDEKIHFKMSPCPLGLEGTSKELCEAVMTSDKTLIKTIIGKEVEMEIPKSMAEGDDYCEGIVKVK